MLIRQTLLYMPAQLLGPLLQFIAAVAWTYWLSPGEYGVLAYVMAAQELAYLLCLGWWSQYMLRFLGDFPEGGERARYQRTENAILAAGAVVQAGVGVVAVLSMHAETTMTMIAASVVYCVSRCLTTHLSERARSAGAIGVYTISQMIGPVAGFGLALIAVSQVSQTSDAALSGFALAQLIGLVWLWRELGLGVALARPSHDIVRQAVVFGLPLVVAGVIGWVSFNGIRVIVEQFDGPAAVGLISVGWGLGQRLAAVVAMLVTAAAFPLAVKFLQSGSREGALRQVSMSGAILFALLAPACVGVVAISRPLVELLIAKPFQDATFAVLPLAVLAGALRNLRVHVADQAFILLERTRFLVVLNTVEVVATVAFCVPGLIYGGLPGATAGCLAGTVVGLVLAYGVAVRDLGFVMPWAILGRVTLASLWMGVALFLVPFERAGAGLFWRVVVEIATGGLVYVVVMAALFPDAVRAGGRMLARRSSATT